MSTVYFPTTTSSGKRIPNPSHPIAEGFAPSTASQKFDSGHEQRRKKGATLSTFQLNYVVLEDECYQAIRNFFISCTDVVSFTWAHPITKTAYVCRFDGQSFSASSLGHNGKTNLWTCKFNIIQVI